MKTPPAWSTVCLAAALGVAAGCGGGSAAPSALPSAVVMLTGANFQQLVLDSPQASLVEFHLPGCPACLAMTETVEALAQDFRGRAMVGTVNAAVEADLSTRYQIRATPTFIVFSGGEEHARRVGVTAYSELAGLLQGAAAAR